METFTLIFAAAFGLILIIINAILALKVRKLNKIFHAEDEDKNSKILLQNVSSELKKLDKDVQELYEINSRLSKITKRGICKAGVTKFNAFSEKSGNQSFAVALLDYQDSGIVISNLQTTQGARIFVRQIQKGLATNGIELLAEEKKALERAKQVVF